MQLFDLHNDPHETHNLALEPQKNRETILRMNGLLNELIATEVGVNDGTFLEPLLEGGSLSSKPRREAILRGDSRKPS